MGAATSQLGKTLYESWTDNSITPDRRHETKFDPTYGFQHERKERVQHLSEEEMRRANVPPQARDYCAHLYIDFNKCIREKFPFNFKCKHERHEYEHCLAEDNYIRMKDYEREKRLLKRQVRLNQKQEAETS